MMRRREFITLFGGAVAWPLGARAQEPQVRRIGVQLSGAESDPEMQARVGALRDGLKALGWIEGRSYQFEYRWPGSDQEYPDSGGGDGAGGPKCHRGRTHLERVSAAEANDEHSNYLREHRRPGGQRGDHEPCPNRG